MHYFCVSWTHKNTDITLREKLSITDEARIKELLRLINANSSIDESFVLSTCNRIEIFVYASELEKIADYIVASLSLLCGVDKEVLFQKADFFEDIGAIHHLFSVASSLDSLVVGETQIAGQLKDAFNFAYKQHFSGVNLWQAIHFAFKCAASIRNETQISKNPVSIASVAVSKAKELLDLKDKEAVVIGAGEMGELACKHLLNSGAKILLLNRNLDKAKNLAKCLGERVKTADISSLKECLNHYELFFSATNSLQCIITDELLQKRDFTRYFFDIAVPRDINLSEDKSIKVFSVDDLEEVVSKNLALREKQAQIAYNIINTMTSDFFKYLNDQALNPIIKALRLKAKDCANAQLEIALKKGYLKKSDEEEARKLIHQVFKAFLHAPTKKLKALQDQREVILDSLRYVFELEDEFEDFDEIVLENDNEI
ncbi:glutamyl-tRNA reductase [Campylobacter sp. MIT 99-7217]|uniref:glutamyl-tRNA reductase n=1 Tax=Campylobacter sp. MIT 99-7217 TaxID=535091 RepID=UPI001157E887|nr:glutamyl-tRNA reductase [Campylobacter sp. MIT 99-7217]TQR31841.1 glutamyl-tRNA reductase [Campylobacter sp. MIT 99-7217]